MLIDQCKLQPGHNVLIWGAAGGLGVFATQLCKAAGANAVGVVSSDEKGELVKQLGAVDYIDRNEFAEMMRKGGESPDEEKERFKASRGFAKRVKEILGDAPDIVFEHVGQATFPTSVFVVKPFGKVVICGATSGYQLDFDVRYLWMRQKQIIGSHFANAYECMRANQLMAEGKIRPVLWQAMGFDGVAEAHQLLHENKHLGKISILVGAASRERGQERGRARSDPGRGRHLSGRRLMPRRQLHRLARPPLPGRPLARDLAPGARPRDGVRRQGLRPDPQRSTTRSTSGRSRSGTTTRTSSATGTRRRSQPSARRRSTTTTSRSCRPGTRRVRRLAASRGGLSAPQGTRAAPSSGPRPRAAPSSARPSPGARPDDRLAALWILSAIRWP